MRRKLGIVFLVFVVAGSGLFYQSKMPSWMSYFRGPGTPADAYADNKRVAITFDDGPSAQYTSFLLDGLKSRGVKASFFVVGQNIAGNEELLKRMYEEGHLIGNHSYHHVQLNQLSLETACLEVRQTNEQIYEITGHKPEFLRPPFGEWDRRCECPETMIPVYWSVDSLDWKSSNPSEVVQRVLAQVEDGDIILLHDIFSSSVEAALTIIDCLHQKGYEFVTVDELILN